MRREISLFDNVDEKAQRICDAAVKMFYRKRFDETTVSEIAANARVGKGTFYLYFKSKEDLLNYLIEHGIEKLISYVSERIKDEKDPAHKLKMAIDAQLYFISYHREYFTFFSREIWSYRDDLEKKVEQLKDKYLSIFVNIIKEGVNKGIFKKIDIETISSGLFGLLSFAAYHWIALAGEFPVELIDESIKKILFKGILVY